jgi:hypothetical protein
MTQDRIEEISGRIVSGVFGAGYVSPAAAAIFQTSVQILSSIPEEKVAGISTAIQQMCIAVGSESAEVGFDRRK